MATDVVIMLGQHSGHDLAEQAATSRFRKACGISGVSSRGVGIWVQVDADLSVKELPCIEMR
jgi:hypothetical protein